MDCEMVEGPRRKPMLAQVAIVNWDGEKIYETYVQPTGPVHDYRSAIYGIYPDMLTAENGARPFQTVQQEVLAILHGNILIGHAIENDLRALQIYHPPSFIRNTAHHNFFKTLTARGQQQPQKLSTLHGRYVGNTEIQQGVHGALEDARAAMRLYKTRHSVWETPVHHIGPLFSVTK